MNFSTVEAAVDEIRAGRFVIVVDDEDRENEGDLILAAEKVTPDAINFMIREGRGLVCLTMQSEIFDNLRIPMMVPNHKNDSKYNTNFGISIGAKHGITTGISAADRAHTVLAAVREDARPEDLSMPGHIFPIRAKENGVLERRGHTEASVDLARLAGLRGAGVICEIIKDDGTMARLPDLETFADEHNIPILTIDAIAAYRYQNETLVTKVDSAELPIDDVVFQAHAFRDHLGHEHLALTRGNPENTPLVRLHSECLTGDVLGSKRCDCGEQLQRALADIKSAEHGMLLYLRQEGRGIGLANKIRAYALQDKGLDTVEANLHLGFPEDARTFDLGAAMLRQLGVDKLRLLTNNPRKVSEIEACGIQVLERVPLVTPPHDANRKYLETKASRLGHVIPEFTAEHKETS